MNRHLLTVGHSNHSPERFVELLSSNGVQTLVDVRSQPYSRHAPHFNRSALPAILGESSIDYIHEADLGGRPSSQSAYDAEGHVLYGRVAASEPFVRAIERVESLAQASEVAVMCGEEDPSNCHRPLLVTRVLLDKGWTVFHIRGDGSLQDESEVAAESGPVGQQGLFEGGEFSTWRSTQSVSRRSRPRSSSDS